MIYCYTITKDNVRFLLRKSKTITGIRKMAYHDLQKAYHDLQKVWLGNDIDIERHRCDNAVMDGDVLINPKTGKVLMGTLIGRVYKSLTGAIIYAPENSSRTYAILPNGEIKA